MVIIRRNYRNMTNGEAESTPLDVDRIVAIDYSSLFRSVNFVSGRVCATKRHYRELDADDVDRS